MILEKKTSFVHRANTFSFAAYVLEVLSGEDVFGIVYTYAHINGKTANETFITDVVLTETLRDRIRKLCSNRNVLSMQVDG